MYEIVTGSHGFCGTHLSDYLLKSGKTVIQLPRELLISPTKLKKFLSAYQPFRIYNLEAYGNLHGQDDKFEIYNAIVGKLLNLLEASKDLDCQGFITAGSSSEYGYKKEPMVETMMIEPTSLYGAAKAAATHLAQAWALQFDKPIVVYRPASITGIGEQAIHLIPTLIRSCMLHEAIQFIPEPTHDYINVMDVVRAVALLCENAESYKGEIFNIGTGKQFTNQQVLDMVEKYSEHIANIVALKNLRVFEKSETWVVNSDKLRKLGWVPEISFDRNIQDMVEERDFNPY